jgi:hypothetical protein
MHLNLIYQTWDKELGALPNSIPFWKRNKEHFKNYGNVKYQYLEELLDYAGITYNKCKPDQALHHKEKFWYHIQPEWIDLSFFYENVFHYIDEDVLNTIKFNKNVNILLWFPSEGFNLSMPRFIDDIMYTLADKNIPEEKVYLVFGDLRIEQNFKDYCKLKNIQSKIKTFGLNIFELNYWLETNRMYFSRNRMTEIDVSAELVHEDLLDKDRIRPKRFVCRNANPRPHRIYIMSQIYKHGLNNHGYTSFLNRYFTPGVPHNIRDFTNNENINEIKTDMELFLEKTPIVLDEDADSINIDLNQRRMDAKHYYDTYFSLINETVCDSFPNDPLFITEKVYQPILQLHPFLVAGSRGTLEYLKDTGYQTFNGFFNESYDAMENSRDRIDNVLKQVKQTCAWPIEVVHKDYWKIFDRLLHNRNHFLNLNKEEYFNKLFEWLDIQ